MKTLAEWRAELQAAVQDGANRLDDRGIPKPTPDLPLIGTPEFIAKGLGIALFASDK